MMESNRPNNDFDSTKEIPVQKPDVDKTLTNISKPDIFEDKIGAPDFINYGPPVAEKRPARKRKGHSPQRLWPPIFMTCVALIVICVSLITTYVWPVIVQNGIARGLVKIVTPIVGIEGPLENTNVLLVGVDKDGYRTDTIMVARYHNDEKTVSVLQIPRDTYVGGNGRRDKKVNSAYFTGIDQLKSEIKLAYGIKIDKYAEIDLAGFRKIVDILGGVEVDVPIYMDYDDPFQDLHIHIRKGKQVLNGEQAEGFVRFRKNNDGSGFPRGDIQRMESQKDFIMSVLGKLATDGIIRIPEIIDVVGDHFKTDLSYQEMLAYATAILDLPQDSITFMESPGKMDYKWGGWYFFVDKTEAADIAKQYFGAAQNMSLAEDVFTVSIDEAPSPEIPSGSDIAEEERESYYTHTDEEEEESEDEETSDLANDEDEPRHTPAPDIE